MADITRLRGQARLAVALQKLGWTIHGFTEGETETDEVVNIAQWHGYAEHPDFPNIVVVCGIDDRNKTEYMRAEWPKFRPTWVGIFYHLEDLTPNGLGMITTASGAYYTGTLSEGMTHADIDADRIHRRAEKETKRKQRKIEKERKAAEREQKAKEREAAKAQKEQAKLDKAAAKAAGKKPAGESTVTVAAPPKDAKEEAKPEDLIQLDLKPISPLILDPVPVVVDALVTALLDEPEWLPPDTDYPAIVATKIATFYGFDESKTSAAAHTLAQAIKSDSGQQDLKQRNTALRSQARNLLH
ncbi:MAG: hypothetical protein U0X20_17205 [Caldilineaceae bacterium]